MRELLKDGQQPRVLLRRPATVGSAAFGLDSVVGNLGDPDVVDFAVDGVEVVYHVGASMNASAEDFAAGTVWGTRNIVNACLKHRVKRLIYVSSLGVLDIAGQTRDVKVNENAVVEPHPERRGLYTKTKLEAERIVLGAISERGLQAVIIRPGQIFGPGAEQVSPSGVIGLAGTWIMAGRGNRPIPLVYVKDVASGLIAAEKSPAALGRIIHLVDNTVVTQNDYLQWCRPALGRKLVLPVPVSVLLIAGALCDLMTRIIQRPLPLSTYRVRSLRPLAPVDASLAERLLGWKPATGTASGLQVTFGEYHQSSPRSQRTTRTSDPEASPVLSLTKVR